MTGILIDTKTGDLLVEQATMQIGNTDYQVAEHVLVAQRGEYKELPLMGGEVKQHLGGTVDKMWRSRLRRMLQAAGVQIRRVMVDGGEIELR